MEDPPLDPLEPPVEVGLEVSVLEPVYEEVSLKLLLSRSYLNLRF